MANNSSTAGFLAPVTAPVEGDSLEDLFHDTIAGVTGIAPDLVRPRWQPEPPNQPDFDADWVAFGIVTTKSDTFTFTGHDPTIPADIVERDEVLTILHSFYGPNGQALMNRFSNGIQVEQNRVLLSDAGIKLVEFQEVGQIPALLKDIWVRRFDCRLIYRRRLRYSYAVLNVVAPPIGVAAAVITLNNDRYLTPIDPSPP
jgi:hypothetical protein